jgi:hypothetical protein
MPALANMTDYAMALPEKERGAEMVSAEMVSPIKRPLSRGKSYPVRENLFSR